MVYSDAFHCNICIVIQPIFAVPFHCNICSAWFIDIRMSTCSY